MTRLQRMNLQPRTQSVVCRVGWWCFFFFFYVFLVVENQICGNTIFCFQYHLYMWFMEATKKRRDNQSHWGPEKNMGSSVCYKLHQELQNGRLAMLAFSGMVHHNLVVKGPLFPLFPEGWEGPQANNETAKRDFFCFGEWNLGNGFFELWLPFFLGYSIQQWFHFFGFGRAFAFVALNRSRPGMKCRNTACILTNKVGICWNVYFKSPSVLLEKKLSAALPTSQKKVIFHQHVSVLRFYVVFFFLCLLSFSMFYFFVFGFWIFHLTVFFFFSPFSMAFLLVSEPISRGPGTWTAPRVLWASAELIPLIRCLGSTNRWVKNGKDGQNRCKKMQTLPSGQNKWVNMIKKTNGKQTG